MFTVVSLQARPSNVDEGSLVLSHYDALQRARFRDVEYLDRNPLVPAQRERSGVHDLQVARQRLVEGDGRVARGGRILPRVRRVHAVDLRRLENDLRADFRAAQRGGRVRGEERVAGAGGEDHDPPLLEVTQRL